MGLGDFLRKQFIDVIQWTESGPGVLMYRFPMRDMEIQSGGKLTVRESQMALFVNEGKAADLFGPGEGLFPVGLIGRAVSPPASSSPASCAAGADAGPFVARCLLDEPHQLKVDFLWFSVRQRDVQ